VFSDFNGFDVLVDSPASFPFVKKKGIHILPGHLNSIALSAVQIEASDEIRNLAPKLRKCLFADESLRLKLHRVYTQDNCFLECAINAAQRFVMKRNKQNKTCTPWYLPFGNETHYLCDPWQSLEFDSQITKGASGLNCTECLPDCRRTLIQSKLSSVPFIKCDERNFGMTELCSVGKANILTKPHIFGKDVLDEFRLGYKKNPSYLQPIVSSIRTYNPRSFQAFHFINRTYDAFERDIAELEVFFDVQTVVEFETNLRMTWVDFSSSVGGLLGLCVGLSVVTVIELIWLGMRLIANFLKPVQINRR